MKIRFNLLVCLLLSSFSFTIAQDIQFSSLSDLPNERSAICSATDGENIFVVNGFGISESYTAEIFQFNTSTNVWSTLTAATIPKRFASSAIVNDKLYVFNGLAENGVLNDQVEVIDLNDGTISLSTTNPQAVFAAGVSVWNGKIYSFGGSLGQNLYSNKLYEFDPATETWTVLTDMPVSLETEGEIVNGKLYVFGGYNGTVSNRIDVYDIASNTWESEFMMPMGISAHATAILGTKIFLIGDFANLNLVASFDTSDNSFSILNGNLESRRHCASEVVNGQLYAIGGNTMSTIQSAIASVQVADFTSRLTVPKFQPIKIFPNPSTTRLHWNQDFDLVQIADLEGRILESYYDQRRQINVEAYASGTYFFIARIGDEFYLSKWVKD